MRLWDFTKRIAEFFSGKLITEDSFLVIIANLGAILHFSYRDCLEMDYFDFLELNKIAERMAKEKE